MTKIINIRITDASGHTDLSQELADAINTVIQAHIQNKRWAYVGSNVFQFTATSAEDPALLQDAARLRELLLSSPDGITVTITGDLVGGAAPQVTLRITDASGHTETIEELSAAVSKVIAAHVENKRWAYINSNVFSFDEDALSTPGGLLTETQRLFRAVEAAGENGSVTVTLTGDLAGGSAH